ncbi:putative Uroporphyrinogen decarboxylase [Hypsibius exemplaris]|uniref:Uroporphyrinogen decarboxylase n=1 Tax=Hypsibius exemplaris TaxID=2072580 RepID=A0A1W0X9F1_HYPEX|nr:putative Uroporphyrinogen decarboxylase [Hypsibius exemplaris]
MNCKLFESHGGALTKDLFMRFAHPYLKEIRDTVKSRLDQLGYRIPMTVFGKDCHYAMQEICDIGYDVVGLDWSNDPRQVRRLNPTVTLQGNLDPCALYSSPEQLRALTADMIKQFGTRRYIANLGHGIYPDMDPAHVAVFIDAVHAYKADQ